MLKKIGAMAFLFLLVGCGRTLADEAHIQASFAFELGEYARGSLLLAAGADELHAQSVYFMQMLQYQEQHNPLAAFRAWVNLNNIESGYSFIEEAANDKMAQFVTQFMHSEIAGQLNE